MGGRCCFLSMHDLAGYVSDDELAIAPLLELDWTVETLAWDSPANWDDFDIVVIRTTWDYQNRPNEFLSVLGDITSSKARLENPLEIVRWNLSKRYLAGLERSGIAVVPTIWGELFDDRSFASWQETFETDELIIKPTISATAMHTYRCSKFHPELADIFADGAFMVQPFLPSVVETGEYSLFYFGGQYSHTILKSPAESDFRVQEEHGGIITAVDPEPEFLRAADKALAAIGRTLLYARVDLVKGLTGELQVMELELIEPSLYLRMDAEAPARFAAAIDRWMSN